MNVVAFILLIIATVLFLVPILGRATNRHVTSSIDLGLAFLAVGLIVQFATNSHPVHF